MSTGVLQRLDRAQKRNTTLSVAVATFKKFSDDKSANFAAMIAFWAFFSVFPLLLVLVTLLAIFLPAATRIPCSGMSPSCFRCSIPRRSAG